jgi:sigma-B regulation protein RsbU (phosphoserine phosphatase)
MNLRKLYHTIETIGSQKFESDESLLKHVLREVVQNEDIGIKGGRIWRLVPKTGSYELIHQIGNMQKVKARYRVKAKDYPIFLELPRLRTVIANESNEYLRKRGILQYSATGIGEKVEWRGQTLYRYVVAFNADRLGDNITATLNIIGAALNALLRSQTIEHKAQVLESDLDKAHEIQKSILPQQEIRFDRYEIYGVSLADRIVGGDFFDYLRVEGDNERMGVVIGDATSKGMSAAVEALYVSGALRLGFQFQSKISVLISQVNKLLHKTFADDHFISLFYAELTDGKNGLVLYANCGHNNPILLRAGSNVPELLAATSQVLGPFPNEVFKTESILMGKGDILLLYTDGITEATNERGEFYGENRLIERLLECREMSPKDITQHILQDVQTFNHLGTQMDDKTIVAIARRAETQ